MYESFCLVCCSLLAGSRVLMHFAALPQAAKYLGSTKLSFCSSCERQTVAATEEAKGVAYL